VAEAWGAGGSLQVDGVPQDDGSGQQGQAAGAVALLVEVSVADLAEAVEEHGARQRVAGFTLVEPAWTRRRSSTCCS
jgi:hypothetical protein